MGWREFRATLLFVLVSLVAGAAYREWRSRSAGGPDDRATFVERLRAMAEESALEEERGLDAWGLAAGPTSESGAEAKRGVVPLAAGARGTPRAASSGARPAPLGSLDVDRAAAADWERLPGIGPALATRIVADRAAHGPFGAPEGLLRVRGIGPKTLERIRPFLRSAAADSASPFAK